MRVSRGFHRNLGRIQPKERSVPLEWGGMRSRETSSGPDDRAEIGQDQSPAPATMAVSIAGISTACSKDALVSSAKAAREALSTE
jgi:hypothetical protein